MKPDRLLFVMFLLAFFIALIYSVTIFEQKKDCAR